MLLKYHIIQVELENRIEKYFLIDTDFVYLIKQNKMLSWHRFVQTNHSIVRRYTFGLVPRAEEDIERSK